MGKGAEINPDRLGLTGSAYQLGGRQRQARLANTGRPDDGQQTHVRITEQRAYGFKIIGAANERRWRNRKGCRDGIVRMVAAAAFVLSATAGFGVQSRAWRSSALGV